MRPWAHRPGLAALCALAALLRAPCCGPRAFRARAGPRVRRARLAAASRAVPPAAAAALEAAAAAAATAEAKATLAARREVRAQLLAVAAATCRGQCGEPQERASALELAGALEALNPTPRPALVASLLDGDWRLVYASEDVTRSSPFFWAWRRLLEGVPNPFPPTRELFGTDSLAESVFAVTDGIPVKTIGEASQHISSDSLVNRVSLSVFGIGRTMMTTRCRLNPTADGDGLELTVETTRPANSTGPLSFADEVVFPSEDILGNSAKVIMQVTYLDDVLRISRNAADQQLFVYVRAT